MSSIVEIYRRFPTAEAAVTHLEKVRWGDDPTCPYCRATSAARHNETGRSRWQCWTCKKSFSATVGTIFHNSHIDLQRWFLLISLMLNAKKGLSAMHAARDLEMRRPTVWSMMHRIRRAMDDDGKLLSGLVEMDEAYVGGKPRKRNRKDDDIDAPRGRGTKKIPVVGAVERGGSVKAKMVNKADMTAPDP
jgi:transposase-like protein